MLRQRKNIDQVIKDARITRRMRRAVVKQESDINSPRYSKAVATAAASASVFLSTPFIRIETSPPSDNDYSFLDKNGPLQQNMDATALEQRRRNRRASFLARSSAVDESGIVPSPRKQTSSPLPHRTQRIYERNHAYSRSWNTNSDVYTANTLYGNIGRDDSDDYDIEANEVSPPSWSPYPSSAHHGAHVTTWKRVLPTPSGSIFSPSKIVLNSAHKPPSQEHIYSHWPVSSSGVLAIPSRPTITNIENGSRLLPPLLHRQAKSMEDREFPNNIGGNSGSDDRRRGFGGLDKHRSQSETLRRQLLRQETMNMHMMQRPLYGTDTHKEQQAIWTAKNPYESNQWSNKSIHKSTTPQILRQRQWSQPRSSREHSGTHPSAEISTEPSSSLASTSLSMDSNHSSSFSEGPAPTPGHNKQTTRKIQPPQQKPAIDNTADAKRQKYKSLFSLRHSIYPSDTTRSSLDSATTCAITTGESYAENLINNKGMQRKNYHITTKNDHPVLRQYSADPNWQQGNNRKSSAKLNVSPNTHNFTRQRSEMLERQANPPPQYLRRSAEVIASKWPYGANNDWRMPYSTHLPASQPLFPDLYANARNERNYSERFSLLNVPH
ncbi:hypothetical protein DdX_11570 [Ditylenchus destructor]|uniref:Uncharacterized protein n=1 Tax=Ditylenchus destructor TaxID=166010 RepID=A0AAD4MWH2_9BILA|nr:hypothetical protein DdX_11570 [Ditylenchus destructor]